MTRPFIWAHRGASAIAPENTMAAFRAALAAGADGLELDLHLSRDGHLVVMHDETVERTTDGHGLLGRLSLRELQALDAGSWFDPRFAGEPVPTLDQVLEEFAGRLRLNLEVKETRAGAAILDSLRRYPAAEAVISSFNWHLLHDLRGIDPALPLAVLLETGAWRRALAIAESLRAVAFHPRVDLVNRPMLRRCRDLALPVLPWTVDDPELARQLFRSGIAGVFTNDPRTIRAVLSDER